MLAVMFRKTILSPMIKHLLSASILLISCAAAFAQTEGQPPPLTLLNREVRVSALPAVVADSRSQSDVMSASVAIAVIDPAICCGRHSACEDQMGSSRSLKELGEKLRGKHSLDSGSSVTIVDQYWPGSSINADVLVNTLVAQRPIIIDWNGHIYVVSGVVFNEYKYSDGSNVHAIRKLQLVDPRYSDSRRNLVFDRETDDWTKVSGLLALAITR